LYDESLSAPTILRSQVFTRVRAPPHPRNNIYDNVHHRDTVRIQQHLKFGVRCRVKTEEHETARSAKESTSPKRRFGPEREPPLEYSEPRRVGSADTWRGIREHSVTQDIQISRVREGADSGIETCTIQKTAFGALKRLR
jgi:hypothetical protein